MKNKPLVSVIVPIYAAEPYLQNCIDSICNQTYFNLEIILIDDQSPDNCPKICDKYAENDSRIKVIHQKNTGVSGARNMGIKCSSGKYIMFVDSDDELLSNAIELLVNNIEEYNADIATATKYRVMKNGEICPMNNDQKIHLFHGEEMLKFSLDFADTTQDLHAKLFDKDFVLDICFADGYDTNEDGYFLFECFVKLPRVIHQNVCVYKYFYRENSISHSIFSEKYLSMLYFADLKINYIRKYFPQYFDDAKNMFVRTQLFFLDVLCSTKDKKFLNYQYNCIRSVRKLYKYHKPINRHHKQLAWIVAHNLYPIYKILIRLKYYR